MHYSEVFGWFDENDQSVYAELLESLPDNAFIAELGVAQGRSICSVAEIVKRKRINVLAVDTFAGTENEGDAHESAKTTDWKDIFYQNVKKFGISDNVAINPERTDEGYKGVADGSLDLVFIDADHSAEAVREDIKNWRPKLKSTGILAGHDYMWPSVRQGLAEAGVEPAVQGNMWFIRPSVHSDVPLFSVVLIARNEAKTLPRALESLKGFMAMGGDVVVVDTGSTDGTAKLASNAGCVVEEVGDRFLIEVDEKLAKDVNDFFVVDGEDPALKAGDRVFNFSAARNYATSLAKCDMVSTMDCDEVFTALDIDKLNELIQQGFTQFEYNFIFAHDEHGNPLVEFTQSKFYDRRAIKWTNVIHEIITGNGRRKYLSKDVLHLEHYQNVDTNRSGYLRGLAYDCFMQQDNDRNLHYGARECLYTGRYRSAIRLFEKHVAMRRWQTEASQSLCFIGDCYRLLGQPEKSIESWFRAYDLEGGRREPLIRISEYYFRRNDWQKAAAYASASLMIPQGDFYANENAYYRHYPHELLYVSLWWLGQRVESEKHWRKALEYLPDHPKYLADSQFFKPLPKVSFLIPSLGRPEGLKRCLDSLAALNYPKELIEVLVDERDEPTVPQKVEDLRRKATGEWYAFASNDTEWTPNSLIHAILKARDADKRFVAVDSGRPEQNEHFIIKADLVPLLEDDLIFSIDFHHVGCDNWLYAQCERLGEYAKADLAKVGHHHFTVGAEYDWVYQRGWSKVEADRAVLAKKLAAL